tara:strand:+ start:1653 stop:2048 length:396 start_codon:yes stop_codon:yes gene_type:complete
MPKFKRIGEDNYIKPKETIQDNMNINKELVIKDLQGYIKVDYKDCDELILGSKIKYITNDGNYRIGGILTKIGYPNYIVLLSPYKKITWSVNLKTNTIFMEDVRQTKKDKIEKDNLYKLYKAGMVEIKQPE